MAIRQPVQRCAILEVGEYRVRMPAVPADEVDQGPPESFETTRHKQSRIRIALLMSFRGTLLDDGARAKGSRKSWPQYGRRKFLVHAWTVRPL